MARRREAETISSESAAASSQIGGDVGKSPIGEERFKRGLNDERFGNLELPAQLPHALPQF
ncbi:MAG: hypothetical protein IAI50_09360 [Candidatus Eremiobacteraeota bacterium]|nr:hypothetical protein [Candidatus Eremiobacteraeota bacterium]